MSGHHRVVSLVGALIWLTLFVAQIQANTTGPPESRHGGHNRQNSPSNHSSVSQVSSHSGQSSDNTIYVSNTPKAPKGFVSTSPKPELKNVKAALSSTRLPEKSSRVQTFSSATTDGTTTKLSLSQVRHKKPISALLERSVCGQVPKFKKRYQQNINESFTIMTGDTDYEEDNDDGEFRILHGIDSISGEWPWIVKISLCLGEGEDEYCSASCTGSLINSRWVITAGHCALGDIKRHSGQMGLYDLLIKEDSVVNVKFDKMIRHPDFKENLENDLSLLRLSEPVKFSDYVQPICLIDKSHKDSVSFTKNRKCYNVGYGLTLERTAAFKLQKLEVEAKSSDECNNSDMFAVHLRDNDVCIGPRKGQIGASCKGDSGGPDVCYDPHTDQWYIFGTVSYGPSECDREEGDKWLTVSVELSKYIDWINETIKSNS